MMARHVWLISKYQPETVERALRGFRFCMSKGITMDEACRFVCYWMERNRQSGGTESNGMAYAYDPAARSYVLRQQYRPTELAGFWNSCNTSGHRYQKAKNAQNYLNGGMKLLEACAVPLDFFPNASPHEVWELLEQIVKAEQRGQPAPAPK